MYSEGAPDNRPKPVGRSAKTTQQGQSIRLAPPKLSFEADKVILPQPQSYPSATPNEFFGDAARIQQDLNKTNATDYQQHTKPPSKLTFFAQTTTPNEEHSKKPPYYPQKNQVQPTFHKHSKKEKIRVIRAIRVQNPTTIRAQRNPRLSPDQSLNKINNNKEKARIT